MFVGFVAAPAAVRRRCCAIFEHETPLRSDRTARRKSSRYWALNPISTSSPVVVSGMALFALAGLRNRRMNLQFALLQPAAGWRATVHRRTAPRARSPPCNSSRSSQHRMRMILRQHPLEIRKVAGQLAAQQQPLANLEEQVIFVAGELNLLAGIDQPPASESRPSPSAAAEPDKRRSLPADRREALHHRQAMPVGRHHHQAVFPQHQQRSVQREPRFFRRDRENRLARSSTPARSPESPPAAPASAATPESSRATCPQCASGTARTPGWPTGSPEASPARPHPAAAAHNPADGVPEWCPRRLSSPGPDRATDAQFQICGGQMNPIPIRFHQDVRQDRNRGLLLDHALRQVQFSYQIGLADGRIPLSRVQDSLAQVFSYSYYASNETLE